MVDREKVVKAWESVLSRDPLDVPWDLIDDTLILLKAQEAVEPRECQYPHGTYACGFCDYIPIGNKDGYRANYCPECGGAVKWDG